MGVKGLWQLLDPLGHPVNLENLESRILAVDASIWIHQSIHGFRDGSGNPLPNAHLLGLFNRICKLLFYGIKPVFVFDGTVPHLKRQTIASRKDRQQTTVKGAERTRHQILTKILQSKAIRDVTGPKPDDSDKGPKPTSSKVAVDLYELPPLPSESNFNYNVESDDTSEEESANRSSVYQKLDEIDVDSEDFKGLPLDVQHETLLELKEMSRLGSWRRGNALPENAEEIGNFQIQQLLNRRKIQRRIDFVAKEMRASTTGLLMSDLESPFWEEQQQQNRWDIQARRIMSEDSSHYFLGKIRNDPLAKDSRATVAPWVSESSETESGIERGAMSITDEEPKGVIDSKVKQTNGMTEQRSGTGCNEKNGSNEMLSLSKSPSVVTAAAVTCIEITSSHDDYVDDTTKIAVTCDRQNGDKSHSELALVSGSVEKPKTVEADRTDLPESRVSVIDDTTKTAETCHRQNGDKSHSELALVSNSVEKPKTLEADLTVLHQSRVNVTSEQEKHVSFDGNCSLVDRELKAVTGSGDANQEYFEDECIVDIADDESSTGDDSDFLEVEPVEIPAKEEEDEMFPLEMFQAAQQQLAIGKQGDVAAISDDAHSFLSSVPKSGEELQLLGEELERETEELIREKGRQERMATTITDQMCAESQELLKLFGIPYVVSPAEAEAQCAVLDMLDLTEGTITDDSDVWLFGARRVYKNFFEKNKEVVCFNQSDIERRLRLNRSHLIALALLTGSDYTEGVRGVGVVSAVEILAEFADQDGFCSLENFRSWWDVAQEQKVAPSETKVKKGLRALRLNEGFPNAVVLKAYTEPAVDSSKEKFSWASPDLDALRRFANSKMGWAASKVDDEVIPIIKRLNAVKARQTRIDSFFPTKMDVFRQRPTKSRRLQRALRKVEERTEANCDSQANDENEGAKAKKSRCIAKNTGKSALKNRISRKTTRKGPKRTAVVQTQDLGLSESSESENE